MYPTGNFPKKHFRRVHLLRTYEVFETLHDPKLDIDIPPLTEVFS